METIVDGAGSGPGPGHFRPGPGTGSGEDYPDRSMCRCPRWGIRKRVELEAFSGPTAQACISGLSQLALWAAAEYVRRERTDRRSASNGSLSTGRTRRASRLQVQAATVLLRKTGCRAGTVPGSPSAGSPGQEAQVATEQHLHQDVLLDVVAEGKVDPHDGSFRYCLHAALWEKLGVGLVVH